MLNCHHITWALELFQLAAHFNVAYQIQNVMTESHKALMNEQIYLFISVKRLNNVLIHFLLPLRVQIYSATDNMMDGGHAEAIS